jgi:hypothetical protein
MDPNDTGIPEFPSKTLGGIRYSSNGRASMMSTTTGYNKNKLLNDTLSTSQIHENPDK